MGLLNIVKKPFNWALEIFTVLYWYIEALYRQFIPPPMKSIDNETILVTGAVGGIGKEICRYIVKCGVNLKLVIWDLNQAELDRFAQELRSNSAAGLKVFPMAVDISSRENVDKACKQVKDKVGPATIIFNNAGISAPGTLLQNSEDEIEKIIQVNFFSHLWIIHRFLPEMLASNHGRIVNICSMGGLKASPHGLPYFASKFAVNGYTEALKSELRLPHYNYTGIKLTTVYPYFVQTPIIFSIAINPNVPNGLPSAYRKVLRPEEVAQKTVDGMRREYEHVYLPWSIPLVMLAEYFMPMKLRYAGDAKFLSSIYFKDPADLEKLVHAPYAPPTPKLTTITTNNLQASTTTAENQTNSKPKNKKGKKKGK